jgi:hypothetical protein
MNRTFVFALVLQLIFLPFFASIVTAAPQNTVPAQLVTSSVKLRVDGNNGHEWGTGTIIDTRQGRDGRTMEALVLTCAHIFRGWDEQKSIEVHLYGENSTAKVFGQCIFYDLEIDLALVAIFPPGPVRAAPIAPDSYRIQPSQQVLSVGCDSGGNPSVWQHQIMSIDRIRTSSEKSVQFHYIQVSGAPVGGRSGGGLFSAEGYLIGVCNTGDPLRKDGCFVPPHMIRHILNKTDLAHIYQEQLLGAPQSSPVSAALTPLAPVEPVAVTAAPPMAMAVPPAAIYADNRSAVAGLSMKEQATLEEITRRQQDGDEVIVIFRSKRNPEIPSDVVVLTSTSDQFRDSLVRSPQQTAQPPYNPVIFSSHGTEQSGRQAVSFPVQH